MALPKVRKTIKNGLSGSERVGGAVAAALIGAGFATAPMAAPAKTDPNQAITRPLSGASTTGAIVLVPATATTPGLKLAGHYSHVSHASHASHVSHYSHYSSRG
jgi:hypothetical protein